MAGNTFGHSFTLTSYGESHGVALGGVVDGCPPLILLSDKDIQRDLDRRRPGRNKFTTARNERDTIHIASGILDGKTTGTPIGMVIKNSDMKSSDYEELKNVYRPGHADYTYQKKYGIRDHQGGGRSSARETAIRVAGGAIAKQFLGQKFNVKVRGYVSQIGTIKPSKAVGNTADSIDWEVVESNSFFWPNNSQIPQLEDYIKGLRKDLDSVGAMVTIEADGVPVGWGAPVFDRLDADIAKALISVNATKGVEFGDGFNCITRKGSEFRDAITPDGFSSNHSGGMLGGISNGEKIVINTAFKPTSSIPQEIETITVGNAKTSIKVKGRHDPCVGIRAVAICEAMVALVLADHALRHQAIKAIKAIKGS